jgi:AraC-like DNA-binding protein
MPNTYVEPALCGQVIVEAAQRAGLPVQPLLDAAGVTPESLANPFAVIPTPDLLALLAEAVRLSGDAAFPARALEHSSVGSWGMYGYAVATRPTVGMAVQHGLHGFRHFHSVVHMRLANWDGCIHHFVEMRAPQLPHLHHYTEYALALCLDVIRKTSGRHLVPDAVHVTHAADAAAEGLQRHFGCAVRFAQSRNELVYPEAWLSYPSVRADAELSDLLAAEVEKRLALLGVDPPRFTELVRAVIVAALLDGGASLGAVSGRLGLRGRSLQHLLSKEGASFAVLLDEERKLRALELLQEPEPLDGVAYRLGYRSATTFIRAFRRWTGQTPSQFRAQVSSARGAAPAPALAPPA